MKKIVFCLLITLSFSSFSQDSLGFVFNKRMDLFDGKSDYNKKTLYFNNGLLNLGNCWDSLQNEGVLLSFVDTTGQLIWKKTYFHPNAIYTQGNDIIALNDSEFYVAGITYIDSINDFDIFVAKFNTQGDSVFFRNFPSPAVNWAYSLYSPNEDTLLLLDLSKPHMTDSIDSYTICLINNFGELDTLYQNPIGTKSADRIFKKGNKFYVGGTWRTSFNHVQIFVDEFNANFQGISPWYPSNEINEYFLYFFSWNDHLYMVSKVLDASIYYRLRISQIDENINSNYETIGPYSFDSYWNNIFVINDTILGLINSDYDTNRIYFLDTLLNTKLLVSFGNHLYNTQEIGVVALTPNFQLAGCGMSMPDSLNPSFDCLTFLTGNILDFYKNSLFPPIPIVPPPIISKIEVYPNPFDEYITLEVPNSDDVYKIQIVNFQGDIVLESSVNNGNNQINTKFLSSGIYLLQISNKNEIQTFKILKAINYKN